MYQNRDFDLNKKLPIHAHDIIKDLQLDILFQCMAQNDQTILNVVQSAFLDSLKLKEQIKYRQAILCDCLKHPNTVRKLYQIANDTIEQEQKQLRGFLCNYPSSILHYSVETLQTFAHKLKELRDIADEYSHQFNSEGFNNLFLMLQTELNDTYLADMNEHLKRLQFPDGILTCTHLGNGLQASDYTLLKEPYNKMNFWERLFGKKDGLTFMISERDESGARALSELKDRSINLAANAVAQSSDHILNFFIMLKTELAFYIGCINLWEQFQKIHVPVCLPKPLESNQRDHSFQKLYNSCLALKQNGEIVGNTSQALGKDLIVITGANQGGKTTFLRSIGQAQLMMQCGMFVTAESFTANICNGLFTHFKREEDSTMKSGKLDEELFRMSAIVDCLRKNSLVLFNESFSSTNEREGSEISRQITLSLLQKQIKIFTVTHLYQFADDLYNQYCSTYLFLRATRNQDGNRNLKIQPGAPLLTAFGEDLYKIIFNKFETQN